MGVFDSNQANKKYNNVIPNYDVDDGVDIVPCTENCAFRDEDKGRCVFETCILNQFPLSIPYHTSITKTCEICRNKFTITFGEVDNPMRKLCLMMCDTCRENLFKLIRGDNSD